MNEEARYEINSGESELVFLSQVLDYLEIDSCVVVGRTNSWEIRGRNG